MKTTILILSFLFATVICYGQNNDLPQREAFKLSIAVDDTSIYSADIKASDFILPENTIQIYPGENIFVEVELEKNVIKSMKTVKENLNPKKTLIISFNQVVEGKTNKGMMLKIENPFKKKLEYKALMFLMNYKKWVPTNVLPVYPKLSSYETWPDLIVTIALGEWKFK